ncbi:MAG: hypothetical protein AAGE52_36385 [Myxococcota bacterium]
MRLFLSLAFVGGISGACGDSASTEADAATERDAARTDSGAPDASAETDAGTGDDTGFDTGFDTGSDAGFDAGEDRIPVVVAYGWQGVRMVSIDEGQTWCETGLMVDDHDDLFRGGTFANGLFVGAHAGQNNRGAIIVSADGYTWEALHRTNFEGELPENPTRQWYGGVAFGNDTWVAAGGCGQIATSPDGRSWTQQERFVDSCLHIRSVAFGDGRFVVGLDDDTWWTSTDGIAWTLDREGAGSTVIWNGSDFVGEVDGQRQWRGRGLCMYGQGWNDNARIFRTESADCSGAVEVARPAHSVTTIAYGNALASDYERGALPDELADCLGR